MCVCWFFFFKKKTAYEMRISDWSSDVCSSDLPRVVARPAPRLARTPMRMREVGSDSIWPAPALARFDHGAVLRAVRRGELDKEVGDVVRCAQGHGVLAGTGGRAHRGAERPRRDRKRAE